MSRAHQALAWVAAIAIVVVACAVKGITPPDDAGEEPFAVVVAVGERGVGRNIDVTVTDVRLARTVSTPRGWNATGRWLVVDVDAAAVTVQNATLLNGVTLETAGLTFSASNRPDSFRGASLYPGLARHGSVAFELPGDLELGAAVLAFSVNADARSDSQIRVSIDLSEVREEAAVELSETGWARS
ncbi:hypothetical protein GCM10025768_05820 [Microbacterium pseudoresistens]|uniref:DUF4352 domain-containing protein n=1 Tax=Microbacterium pseudoresistens TaxID=640634 RepID=A0A7Y9EUX4_9MICO|nr:hypothetical protein [Microbacterium pseudoresistens]NYD54419.1 hypothetical protein [Microbacterium pseudoresistens]